MVVVRWKQPKRWRLLRAGLTISFSGEIPVIGGNGIPVNFGRIFLNFENEIFRKYRNIFPRYRAETKNFTEIRRNFKP